MNLVLLTLGGILTLISLAYVILNRKHRNAVFARLGLQRSRTTEIFSPLKSLTPEKQGLPESNKPPTPPTYGDAFPPHRREALAELPQDALRGGGKSAQEVSALGPDYSRLTPDKHVCNSDEMLARTTATGFTVEEIKRLGDFPDYATLSGVPLPQPYPEFDIKTAKPRPYRPLRWAYHQTMCKIVLRNRLRWFTHRLQLS